MKAFNLWKSLMLSAALLTAGAMTSCEKDDNGGDFEAKVSTNLESQSVTVVAGETLEFVVTSNTTWTATVEDADGILVLSKDSGKSGNTSVTATISAEAQHRQFAKVTFTAMSHIFGFDVPATTTVTFTVKGEVTPSDAPMITEASELTAGKYYMSGYGTLNGNSEETFTTSPYHLWDGKLYTSNGKSHLETTTYSYENGVLTKVGNYDGPATVELEEAEGSAFYIKVNGQYLSVSGTASGSLALSETPYAWTPSQLSSEEGYTGATGILMKGTGSVYLGTGKAGSALIRMYNYLSNSYGTALQGGLVFFNPDKVTFGSNSGSGEPAVTEHAGTAEDPYTVADAIAVAKATGTTETEEVYYIEGYVKTITENFAAQYGNATFSLADALEGNDPTFGAYRVNYLGNQKWTEGNDTLNLGDKVVVCGQIINYYGNTPQVSNSTNGYLYKIVSTGNEVTQPDETPDTVSFESDAIFVCSADDSGNAAYTLGANSTFNDKKATGFKLGTSSKAGKFTSQPVGVTGDRTLTLYGGAWNNAAGKLKVSVNGGGSVEGTDTYSFAQNPGVKLNAPFTLTVNEGDKYTFTLKNLTENSTVTFETVDGAYRVVVAGIHLEGYTGGGEVVDPKPEPEPDPTPGGDAVVDVLNQAWTGVTGTSYTDFGTKNAPASTAVYTGLCAGDKNSIQLRSATDKNYSGVVTTTSGGKVTKVAVKWVGDTLDARVLDVYGKKEAYTSAQDLYSADTQGEVIASFTKGDGEKEIEITGDYTYIGFRSRSSALYLDEVKITWE